MEAAFEALKATGKNDVESIIQWMKDAKLIMNKATEESTKLLFGKDKGKIEFAEFKTMLEKFAEKSKMTYEDIQKKLTSGTVQAAVQGASTALGNLFK